jgi:probable O-glycosylation ligase (exosortase A-associated)
MRNLLLLGIVFGSIPFILAQPYIGVLVWSWLGYMNPHRFAYGFAYSFPFAAVVAGATLLGVLFTRESRRIPWNAQTISWFLLIFWMCVTTVFAFYPDQAFLEWKRTMKIMLISIVTLMVMQRPERLRWLVWVIVISIGFFGAKGGLFTILTGGSYLVWGPDDSFIEDNNSIGLAMAMTVPLMRYLQLTTADRRLKLVLTGLMVLTLFAILGTRSRGAMLATAAMGLWMWRRSSHKALLTVAMAIAVTGVLAFAPSSWWERMETIKEYRQDASAMGRINAWQFAWNLAMDRPFVGGGFDTFERDLFQRYAPEPDNFHDAHSIYFEMLGKHGFVGLALYLLVGWLSLRSAKWVIRNARDRPDLNWAYHLAAMTQAGLVTFAVGGAFLSFAQFDLYYHLVVIVACTRAIVQQALQEGPPVAAVPEAGVAMSSETPQTQRT